MIVFGIILMILGGYIFVKGEKDHQGAMMIVGGIINFVGIGMIIAGI